MKHFRWKPSSRRKGNMAKQRVRIGLNEQGQGQLFIGDTEITGVCEIRFTAKAGEISRVEFAVLAPVDVKADAEVVELKDEPKPTKSKGSKAAD